MPNEMRRPCTLWGHTFDAIEALHVKVLRREGSSDVKKNGGVVQVCNDDCDVLLYRNFIPSELNYTLYAIYKAIEEALQAPVSWTDEVKEAFTQNHARLKEESYRYIVSRYSQYGDYIGCKLSYRSNSWRILPSDWGEPICINKYADSFAPICEESFRVLLQFYTDGTHVVVK